LADSDPVLPTFKAQTPEAGRQPRQGGWAAPRQPPARGRLLRAKAMKFCGRCANTRWVCEAHLIDRVRTAPGSCCCGAPSEPCPVCDRADSDAIPKLPDDFAVDIKNKDWNSTERPRRRWQDRPPAEPWGWGTVSPTGGFDFIPLLTGNWTTQTRPQIPPCGAEIRMNHLPLSAHR
jgi:hypothetical protein